MNTLISVILFNKKKYMSIQYIYPCYHILFHKLHLMACPGQFYLLVSRKLFI